MTIEQIRSKIPNVDHSVEGHFRTMLRIMVFFFVLSIVWSVGVETGLFQNAEPGERMFQVGQLFLSVALGIGVGKSPIRRNGNTEP